MFGLSELPRLTQMRHDSLKLVAAILFADLRLVRITFMKHKPVAECGRLSRGDGHVARAGRLAANGISAERVGGTVTVAAAIHQVGCREFAGWSKMAMPTVFPSIVPQ